MNPLERLKELIDERDLWESTISLQRNELLKGPASTDTNIYYIVSGTIRAFVMDETEELTIRLGYSGNVFGALDSFLSDRPSDICIEAIKQSELKVISKNKFMQFIGDDEHYLHLWNQLLSAVVCDQLERERDILTSSPMKRYQRVLARSPHVFQEVPAKYIASYLRMTPETLSRIRKS